MFGFDCSVSRWGEWFEAIVIKLPCFLIHARPSAVAVGPVLALLQDIVVVVVLFAAFVLVRAVGWG